ncbi:MAG TPA: TfoX/Sxy family protein [Legionella sp.]|nr:TfoX/Sxy family protein [Legionella sp.]
MATRKETIDFILDQISNIGTVTAKKMFGEYALYHHTKIVALVCDDNIFIKPTHAGKEFIGETEEHPPYPGAKHYFLISGDKLEDFEWLSTLILITSNELPLPKKKK